MSRTAKDRPSLSLLQAIVLDPQRDLPLHAQLRTALAKVIETHFPDESTFYSESQLIRCLGVSQGTVRRALADLALSGVLEKRPARGTIVRKQSAAPEFLNLAVFLPDYSSPNIACILSLLNAECLSRNINLLPIYTHRGERLLKAYNGLRFGPHEGGVILLANSPRVTSELSSALQDRGYRCVTMGTLLRQSREKFVGTCNASIIRLGMDHLLELGHRRITLLVNEPEEFEDVQERIAAFQAYAEEKGGLLKTAVVRSGIQLGKTRSTRRKRPCRRRWLALNDPPRSSPSRTWAQSAPFAGFSSRESGFQGTFPSSLPTAWRSVRCCIPL